MRKMSISLNNPWSWVNVPVFESEGGCLVTCSREQGLPFNLHRVFSITNVKGECRRGNHANKKSKFVFVMLKGECKVHVEALGRKSDFVLNTPAKGLYMKNMVWKEMYDFSHDAVLLVLSDSPYDPDEYINDHNEFLTIERK